MNGRSSAKNTFPMPPRPSFFNNLYRDPFPELSIPEPVWDFDEL